MWGGKKHHKKKLTDLYCERSQLLLIYGPLINRVGHWQVDHFAVQRVKKKPANINMSDACC